jgi:hypothetical protein
MAVMENKMMAATHSHAIMSAAQTGSITRSDQTKAGSVDDGDQWR